MKEIDIPGWDASAKTESFWSREYRRLSRDNQGEKARQSG